MKNLLYLLALVVLLTTGCDKPTDKGKLDPNAMIALNYKAPTTSPNEAKQQATHLTAKEIVEQAEAIQFWNVQIQPNNTMDRGFAPHQKDFVNNRLLMYGTDIIDQDGNYNREFIEATDMILVKANSSRTDRDTIAYIPNAIMRDAEAKIKAAYAQKDYKTCYELMDKTFTFTPVTAQEYEALKLQGKN